MSQKKTGIFYRKNPAAVVVMHNGEELYQYPSVEAFVDAHVEAIEGIKRREAKEEDRMERLFAAQYMPVQPPDTYSD